MIVDMVVVIQHRQINKHRHFLPSGPVSSVRWGEGGE